MLFICGLSATGSESKFYMYNYYLVSILGKPKLWSFVIGTRHYNNLDLCCLLLSAKSLWAQFKILSKTACISNWVKTIVLNFNSHFNDNSCVLLVVTEQENIGQSPLVERYSFNFDKILGWMKGIWILCYKLGCR